MLGWQLDRSFCQAQLNAGLAVDRVSILVSLSFGNYGKCDHNFQWSDFLLYQEIWIINPFGIKPIKSRDRLLALHSLLALHYPPVEGMCVALCSTIKLRLCYTGFDAAPDQGVAGGYPIYSTGKHRRRESKLFSH